MAHRRARQLRHRHHRGAQRQLRVSDDGLPMSEGVVTPEQWSRFETDGYARLGRLLGDDDLTALQLRIDEIMLGQSKVDYSRLLMQLDGDSEQTQGFKGATLQYRKIQGLEMDPLFRTYLCRPIFRNICQRIYGCIPISVFRSMFMNKPARR